MFRIGSKVRCALKGEQGGVVLWSDRNTTGILVGDEEVAYDNTLLQSIEKNVPAFQRGQLVRHIHRGSIRGYVFRCGAEKTTIMMRAGWEESLAVFDNDLLEPAKPKKPKKIKGAGGKGKSSILNNSLDTSLQLPAIFVDASMGADERTPRICAVLIGYYGEILYYAVEAVECARNTSAERQAIRLGIKLRTNKAWPIYTDLQGSEKAFANVIWIPREKNRIADKLLRGHV